MAYAEAADVLARGGALLADVDEDSTPSTTQITAWLADAEGIINAALAGHAIATPVTGDAAAAVKGCAIDYALVAALEARFSAGSGTPGSAPLPALEGARARWSACETALAAGTHAAIRSASKAARSSDATDAGSFFTTEGDAGYVPDPYDGTVHNLNIEPTITRGMPT